MAQAITSKTASQPWGEGVSPVFVQMLLSTGSPSAFFTGQQHPKKTLQGHLL